MRQYKCEYQKFLIESTNERFPQPTEENIREIVSEWERECARGRALSDDTLLLQRKIRKYLGNRGLEYNTQNLTDLGLKRYLRLGYKPENKEGV